MNKEDRYIYSLASIQIAPGTCLTSHIDASAIWYTSCLFSIRSMSDLERYLPRIAQFPDNAQSSGILSCLSFHTTWRTLWTGCHSLATLRKKENKLSLELNGLKVAICKVTLLVRFLAYHKILEIINSKKKRVIWAYPLRSFTPWWERMVGQNHSKENGAFRTKPNSKL